MGKGRVRLRAGKGERWRKGQSSSSNPETNKHRMVAKGRFGSHLSQATGVVTRPGLVLTKEALATHDAIQGEGDGLAFDKDGDVNLSDVEEASSSQHIESASSKTGLSSLGTSTVYSLIETSHPVFGKVKRLWNSPMESHREICAVLAAVSEVIKTNNGNETETEYFGALMTSLEASDDEKSAAAITYLLSLILPKVPPEVLQSRYSQVCKIIADKLSVYETSDSTALLKGLVTCLTALLAAQDGSIWSDGYTQRVFQTLLNYTIHPKPRLRKAAQVGVASMLREGVATGDFHPSAGLVMRHCKHVVEKGGVETATLHILGLLKDCLANFPTQHVKTLCEMILKLMTLSNSVVRTTGLKVLNSLFLSMAEPQGLSEQLNAQLISALYDYQPALQDAQLLQAWLTVMQSAHAKLALLNLDLCLGHLPWLFQCCVSCLLSNKAAVKQTSADAMQELLNCCVSKCVEQLQSLEPAPPTSHREGGKRKRPLSSAKPDRMNPTVGSIQAAFKAVESGLKYKYYSSWDHVLRVMVTFYQVAGSCALCQPFLAKALPSLCDLRSSGDFPFTTELDATFGTAVKVLGPRLVLEAVPLQLDEEAGSLSHDFPRSWILPVMKEYIEHTELAYFSQTLLPLAARLRTKGIQKIQAFKPLEAKLYATLQFQIWSLLPRFCLDPTDLSTAFPMLARILGSALNERVELRPIVCHALTVLIERNAIKDGNKLVLSRFSKNYLPILFNLYTDTECKAEHRTPLMDCIKAYVSITDSKLLESFYDKAMGKLKQEDLTATSKHLVFDLVLSFTPYLSLESLNALFAYLTPLLDSDDGTMQKKAYTCLSSILSSSSASHKTFLVDHAAALQQILLESLSTSNAASKKPRLKCLLHLADQVSSDSTAFINNVLPEVILCTKEVNEKTRLLAFKLLIKLGYTAQNCQDKKPDEAVSDYFLTVLAGLAGSAHMVSATLLSLSRLVYEFHDLLGTKLVKRLLSSTCILLSHKSREVVRATLEFIKVTIGVLPASEIVPHVEDLVTSILSWSENTRSHFRLKARVILERLIRKCGFEVVASYVPEKHRKLIVHIRKMNERQKKKRQSKMENTAKGEKQEHAKKTSKPSYEELLLESSDEEDEQGQSMKGGRKTSKNAHRKQEAEVRGHGQAWIREGGGDEPVNFLDPSVTKRVSATNPAKTKFRRQQPSEDVFKTNPEGKLIIKEEKGEDEGQGNDEKQDAETEEMEVDESVRIKRKRRHLDLQDDDDDDDDMMPRSASGRSVVGGGGKGIHRANAHKYDFDFNYGAEYKAKKAKGDIKKQGKPDPYAYVPLMRQKLNRRKQAKLVGQFSGFMKKAKKGSAVGAKQHRKRR